MAYCGVYRCEITSIKTHENKRKIYPIGIVRPIGIDSRSLGHMGVSVSVRVSAWIHTRVFQRRQGRVRTLEAGAGICQVLERHFNRTA